MSKGVFFFTKNNHSFNSDDKLIQVQAGQGPAKLLHFSFNLLGTSYPRIGAL